MSLSQRRRVVDAIAGHRHESARSLKLSHYLNFLIRKNLRDNFIDVQLAGNCLSRFAAVTREHDNANAFFMQLPDRLRCGLLNRVSHPY